MALLTKRVIMQTFQEMLEEMPFDRITVSALVRRCGISSNTFYYHYQDIYALLDVWAQTELGRFIPAGDESVDWRQATRALLRECRAHPATIYHVFNSLSRDRMEQYVFSMTDDVFYRMVRQALNGRDMPEAQAREIAAFCRYAYIGFFMQFLWNRMSGDIDQLVDRLGELFSTFITACIEKDGCTHPERPE